MQNEDLSRYETAGQNRHQQYAAGGTQSFRDRRKAGTACGNGQIPHSPPPQHPRCQSLQELRQTAGTAERSTGEEILLRYLPHGMVEHTPGGCQQKSLL